MRLWINLCVNCETRRMAVWKDWVACLPPHDALSAIYRSGDVPARFAAAATAAPAADGAAAAAGAAVPAGR